MTQEEHNIIMAMLMDTSSSSMAPMMDPFPYTSGGGLYLDVQPCIAQAGIWMNDTYDDHHNNVMHGDDHHIVSMEGHGLFDIPSLEGSKIEDLVEGSSESSKNIVNKSECDINNLDNNIKVVENNEGLGGYWELGEGLRVGEWNLEELTFLLRSWFES